MSNIFRALQIGYSQLINQSIQPCSRATGKILNKPTSIFIEITNECIMKCRMCINWKNKGNHNNLTTDDKIEIINDLYSWLGPFYLTFSGGEPLMKLDELCRLAKYSYDRGIITSTNTAAFLLNEKSADAILESGLSQLLISLDSITEKTHDKIRGRSGTFKRIMNAIKYLNKKRSGMRLAIRAIIIEQNINELVDMVKWAADIGLDGIGFHALESRVTFGEHADFNSNWHISHPLWPKNDKKTLTMLDKLLELKNDGYPIDTLTEDLEHFKTYYSNPNLIGSEKNCYVGVKNFIITSNGDVHLCFNHPKIGSIKNDSARNLWKSEQANKSRHDIFQCVRNCNLLACNRRNKLISQAKLFLKSGLGFRINHKKRK